jgi:hypothetical protein
MGYEQQFQIQTDLTANPQGLPPQKKFAPARTFVT